MTNYSPSLKIKAAAEIERRRRERRKSAPEDWQSWLQGIFPSYVSSFAPHHEEMWDWCWNIQRGERPRPFIGIWPRGGGKSTSAELASVLVGARDQRKYVLYVRSTQEQADNTISNISAMLESPGVEQYYPGLGEKMMGKFGNSKGWRRNRLRTSSGLTIDGIGLDTAARGARVDEDRPDLIIFDDVDEKHDSTTTTSKKIATITTSLLPAGSVDAAVLGIQNLIIPNGVFSQLANGEADFLHQRIVSGPIPAVYDLTYEQTPEGFVITGGTPAWSGQNLDTCQRQINDWGLSAFLQEAQHEVDDPPGGMFSHLEYEHCTHDDVPPLRRVVVWMDPAVTDTDQSDSHAVQVDGLADNGKIYRLYSWEQRATPQQAMIHAILKAVEFGAMSVGVETDQGGDTWVSVYNEACREIIQGGKLKGFRTNADMPAFQHAKAGAGHGSKVHRASLMLSDYEKGKFIHVQGTHTVLERALRRFPLTKPFDLTDVCYWSWHDLKYNSVSRRARTREY